MTTQPPLATATASTTIRVVEPTSSHPRRVQTSNCFGRVWGAYTHAMEEGGTFLKGMFRLTNSSAFFARYFNPSTPQSVANVGTFAKQAKNLTSLIGLPASLERVYAKAANFNIKEPIESTVGLAKEVCGAANGACDTVEFVTNFTPLPPKLLERAKVTNFVATTVGALLGTGVYADKLRTAVKGYQLNETRYNADQSTVSVERYEAVRERKVQQIVSSVLSLATSVSYLALGILGMVSLYTPVAPVAIVACLLLGTLFGLAEFFHTRVADPYDKKAEQLLKSPFFSRAIALNSSAAAA